MANKLKVTARALPDGSHFIVVGQEAKTLLMLHERGNNGATVLDFPGQTGFRLAAYVHALIKNQRLNIEIKRERHEGGFHGRWFLRSNVELIAIEHPQQVSHGDETARAA